ncbi:MAG: ArsC family reductase [Spirosomataceae bacterium]
MLTVYGIPNCDTIKKTLTWLKENQLDYQFHDYKKEGITIEKLEDWASQIEWTKLLNTAGTTFKKMDEAQKAAIKDADSAIVFMKANPSAIKRPIIERNDQIIKIGWKPEGL